MTTDDTTQSNYVHGYDDSLTTAFATRTAASEASFFLPHLKPSMQLLDCGCGPGSITNGLAEYLVDGHVTGIDIEESEIEKARLNAAEKSLKNTHYEIADVYNLPYPDNSFDAVFSHALLQHLDDPMKAIAEMKRVLRSNGIVGLRAPDLNGLIVHGPDPEILKKQWEIFVEDWRQLSGDPFIGRRLRGLMHEAGFSRIQASASYENFGTPDRIKTIGQFWIDYFQNTERTTRAIQSGIATKETLDQVIEGIKDWSEHPESFLAQPFCEVIGVKE